MRTFKGFNNNLQATCGKGTFQYQPGVLYQEEKSKTRSTGFHAAEYILDCMRWYPLNGKNRFFKCMSGGSIDEEEGCSMVVSTELRLEEELNLYQIAYYAMVYMLYHPTRDWEYSDTYVTVGKEILPGKDTKIAIARGTHPVVYGTQGILGMILEDQYGEIIGAKIAQVGKGAEPGKRYTLTADGEVREA